MFLTDFDLFQNDTSSSFTKNNESILNITQNKHHNFLIVQNTCKTPPYPPKAEFCRQLRHNSGRLRRWQLPELYRETETTLIPPQRTRQRKMIIHESRLFQKDVPKQKPRTAENNSAVRGTKEQEDDKHLHVQRYSTPFI